MKDGSQEVPLFTYSTYNDDDIVKTVPLIYFPNGVTPSQGSQNNYLTTGGRDATLYITTAHGTQEEVTSFTLYAGSDESAGAPKAEVRPEAGGTILIKEYQNTFDNFYMTNSLLQRYTFQWSPSVDVIQRKATQNQAWYMRGTAVTGDMYVYTIEEVTQSGQSVRTGRQRLEDWPDSSSGDDRSFPV